MSDSKRVVKAKRDPYQALVAAGVPASEASAVLRVVSESLRGFPDDGDPFPALTMQFLATITEADVEAARADWYASDAIPDWAKRLLDARDL